MKPRVFVGSSTESLTVAYALQENLEYSCEVTVWSQGLFDLSTFTLDSLVTALARFDFGVFVLGPEDILKLRGTEYQVARDNVVFELGLFIGRLGRERNYLLIPSGSENFHLPTDLLGLTPATYRADREDGNLVAALGPASSKLVRTISKLGPFLSETELTLPVSRDNRTEKVAGDITPNPTKVSTNAVQADQGAAICYRLNDGRLEFLLIKTSSRRWIFPKGNLKKNESIEKVIERCAREEAGVVGRISPNLVANFDHVKKSTETALLVSAFLLEVEREVKPIDTDRNPTWFALEPAMAALIEGRSHHLYWELLNVLHKAIDIILRMEHTSGNP